MGKFYHPKSAFFKTYKILILKNENEFEIFLIPPPP